MIVQMILINMIMLKILTMIHIFHNCMFICVFIVHAFTLHRLVHFTFIFKNLFHLINKIRYVRKLTVIITLLSMIMLKILTMIHILHNCMLIYVFIVHAFTLHRLVHFISISTYLFHQINKIR